MIRNVPHDGSLHVRELQLLQPWRKGLCLSQHNRPSSLALGRKLRPESRKCGTLRVNRASSSSVRMATRRPWGAYAASWRSAVRVHPGNPVVGNGQTWSRPWWATAERRAQPVDNHEECTMWQCLCGFVAKSRDRQRLCWSLCFGVFVWVFSVCLGSVGLLLPITRPTVGLRAPPSETPPYTQTSPL